MRAFFVAIGTILGSASVACAQDDFWAGGTEERASEASQPSSDFWSGTSNEASADIRVNGSDFWAGGADASGEFNRSYIAAAMRGDLSEVLLHLQLGVPIDVLDGSGRTALWHAASNGHSSVMDRLLAEGSDPNIPDHSGRTASDLIRELAVIREAEAALEREQQRLARLEQIEREERNRQAREYMAQMRREEEEDARREAEEMDRIARENSRALRATLGDPWQGARDTLNDIQDMNDQFARDTHQIARMRREDARRNQPMGAGRGAGESYNNIEPYRSSSSSSQARTQTARVNQAQRELDRLRQQQAQRQSSARRSINNMENSEPVGPIGTGGGSSATAKRENVRSYAVCAQNEHGLWNCDGPVQRTMAASDSISTQQQRSGCTGARFVDRLEGSRFTLGWGNLYECTRTQESYDTDIISRYSLTGYRYD